MILKMNQDTCGDFLRYQESPGMTADTTILHKTLFQNQFAQDFQDFVKNVDPGPHVHSELEFEVDTIGIHVENHEGVN